MEFQAWDGPSPFPPSSSAFSLEVLPFASLPAFHTCKDVAKGLKFILYIHYKEMTDSHCAKV